MADNEGLDTGRWSEIKDWRNWEPSRRCPLNRTQVTRVFIGIAVALIVATTARAVWPHLWVAPVFFMTAAVMAFNLVFDVLARHRRRSRLGPPPFDQEWD